MAGPRIMEKGFAFWPEDAPALPTSRVIQMYRRGFAGAYAEPQEREAMRDEVLYPQGADAAHAGGWAGSAEGNLVMPFVHVLDLWPEAWPGPGQDRGDCVSHDTKNAGLLTVACEIVAGEPDEHTRVIEGAPAVPPVGVANGVFSSEAIYWWRRHGGDGWSCPAAARVIRTESGLWIRQDYPELDIDLEEYSGRKAGLWGRRTPPDEIKQIGQEHLIRQTTELDTFEELRDFLSQGYGVSTCGGEGWSGQRDEHGVARQRGRWAHAMAAIGADDRDSTKDIYGEPLALIQNSWGKWNGGPRDVRDSAQLVPPAKRRQWMDKGIVNAQTGNVMIPDGSFWTRWSDARRRYLVALSSFDGWPAQKLPDWGGSLAG